MLKQGTGLLVGSYLPPSLLAQARTPARLKMVIEDAVADVFFLNISLLRGPSRGQAQIALARQVSMYIAHCAFSLSHAEVGRIFGRDRTTVRHACAVVEDRRDDPAFDWTMANLEEIVRRLGELRAPAPRALEMA